MPNVYFWSGHRQIGRIVAGDLQKDSAVGSTFVSLAGGVQEARTESQTRSHSLAIAQRLAQFLQECFVLRVHLDVSQQRKVIAGTDAIKMRAQISRQRFVAAGSFRQSVGILRIGEQLDAAVFENRLFGGQGSSLFVFVGQFASRDLAGFDVRLVEGD